MNKLRKKVFWTIFGIMSAALLLVVIVYNVVGYIQTSDMLHKNWGLMFGPDKYYADMIIRGYIDNLITSLFVLAIFLVAFYFIAKLLTGWIVEPVEDAFNKQKDFIADASHELKTPLSVITTSSDVLEKDPTNKQLVNNIQTEANNMNRLINKLLDLASTEKTSDDVKETHNISKTVELSALSLEAKAHEKSCKIVQDIQPDINFKYNEDDIRQLVQILLDNAIKHADEGSNIVLSLSKASNKINMVVTNQGEAIAPGDEEKIFERFYRVDKVRNTQDHRYGLGLSIAKNIVKNHNGKIWAKSSDGKTNFYVVFTNA